MIVAFDTETELIQPGLMAPPLVCGSWARPEEAPSLTDATSTLKRFRVELEIGSHLVGHNVSYDLGVLCAADPSLVEPVFKALDEGRIHDTGIRESLIDIALGQLGMDPVTGRKIDDDEGGAKYPLSALVTRYFGVDISADKSGPDTWRYRYARLKNVLLDEWPEAAVAYPKADAEWTLKVYLAQATAAEKAPNFGNLHDEARSVRNAWALHLITLWGLRTNPDAVAALEARVEGEHLKAMEEFKKLGIVRPDGTEDKAKVQALVTAAYNGDPPRTPTGAVATDRDTKLESGDAVLIAHGTSGKSNKYRTTYLPKLKKGIDRPINPSFYGMAATTRVTSDYQQLPQKGGIRECHEARPGFVYCSVDYGGLELRTMSQRAIWTKEVGFSKMAEALLAKEDPHCIAGANMLGVPVSEFTTRYKAKDTVADSFRKLAKIFNFGKGGGMGAKALVYNARAKENVRFCLLTKSLETCGSKGFIVAKIRGQAKRVCSVCVEIAVGLNDAWLDAWPEQRALFSLAGFLTQHDSAEVTIPHINILRSKCGYSQWLNTPFQGLGAVITTLAMWRISREMYVDRGSVLYGSRLVLNVHDELVAELREDVFREAAERMALLMRQAGAEVLPDLGPAIEAEPAVSRILSKDAATVRDSEGRLQIWEPQAKAA